MSKLEEWAQNGAKERGSLGLSDNAWYTEQRQRLGMEQGAVWLLKQAREYEMTLAPPTTSYRDGLHNGVSNLIKHLEKLCGERSEDVNDKLYQPFTWTSEEVKKETDLACKRGVKAGRQQIINLAHAFCVKECTTTAPNDWPHLTPPTLGFTSRAYDLLRHILQDEEVFNKAKP